jgi:hypothetical protein
MDPWILGPLALTYISSEEGAAPVNVVQSCSRRLPDPSENPR